MLTYPSGTVAFLFTDIEGSTKRWETDQQATVVAVQRHFALLDEAVTAHEGVLFKKIGDAAQAAFATVSQAIRAAIQAQIALRREDWGELGALGVRMAIHAGEAMPKDGDYLASALNRLTHLLGIGYGQQILLTDTARALATMLPVGYALQDLGRHQLQDLLGAERIFQLCGPGLPAEFPPLKSLNHQSTNLPAQPTPLIGREHERAALGRILMDPETRLVTLVGPGGTGKTRLALQVAAEVLETFPDGVWWVPLAGVTDPALVPQAIAVPLGVRENAGRPVLATLAEHLTSRRTLLFLDNAEHLLPAVPQISSLLDAAPGLVMLVTSREPLRLRAEHEFPVTPLPLPSPGSGLSAKAALAFPAVRLFVERAHVVKPTFRLDADNVADVIAICQRLDGLPLAIELAAPQVRFLSPMALFARLNQGLAILAGQTRDLPARQRTMRATIAWSYDLLSTEERALFRRLSVFVGGFTLEAVAAVVSGEENLPFDALDKVAALVDHSLVRPVETDDPEPRFELLETIRAYGRERLAESGDETPVRNAHAAYFLTLAAEACLAFEGSKRSNAREQVAREFDNLRAALSWAVERGDAEIAQRLATHLARFWVVLGLVGEGRAWLDRAVALDGPSLPETRADALSWAAQFASHQDAVDHAERRAMEAMAVAREGSYDRGVAMALHQFGQVAHRRGDLAKAAAYFEDAVARFRRLNESIFEGIALRDLGVVAGAQDEHDRATAHHEEALAVWRKLDHPWGVPAALRDLADEALCRGDVVAALPLYREALGRWRLLGEKLHVAGALLGPATVALEGGQAEHAARLLGASAALHEAIGVVPPDLPCDLGDGSERARAALGEAAFETAWATGRAFSVEEAIVDALAVAAPAPSSDLSPGSES